MIHGQKNIKKNICTLRLTSLQHETETYQFFQQRSLFHETKPYLIIATLLQTFQSLFHHTCKFQHVTDTE